MCTDPFTYNKNQVNTSLQPVIRNEAKGVSKSDFSGDKEKEDILDWLLQAGLAPVVTQILLLLDPPSLHSAKQVDFLTKKAYFANISIRCVSCGGIISRMRFGVVQR